MKESGAAGLIEFLRTSPMDVVPKEWKTTRDWSVEIQRSESRTLFLLREGVKTGRVERRKFRIETDAGIVKPVPHYRMVK